MYFQTYVYIIFVHSVAYVDMSTRSSQRNHLNLESFTTLRFQSPDLAGRPGMSGMSGVPDMSEVSVRSSGSPFPSPVLLCLGPSPVFVALSGSQSQV